MDQLKGHINDSPSLATSPAPSISSSPLLSSYLIFLYHSQDWMKAGRFFFFFFFSPTCLKTCSKKSKKSQPTHLNFGAVNNWASSRVPPRWGQLLESQREAAEKSSFIMKAQREPSVLMTNKPNEVCSPLHPAPPSLPPSSLTQSVVGWQGPTSEGVCQRRVWQGDASEAKGGERTEIKRDGQLCLQYLAEYIFPLSLCCGKTRI